MSRWMILSSCTFSILLIYKLDYEMEWNYHLYADQKDCFEIELSFAGLEEVLKTRPKHVHYHHMKMLFLHWSVGSHII
jgi:hypothetical protein